MKSLIFIPFLLVFIYSTSFSQETSDDESYFSPKKYTGIYNNYVGLKYSNISGYGLVLGNELFDNFRVEVCSYFRYDKTTHWTNMTKDSIELEVKNNLYDFGVELSYDFFTSRNIKLYVLLGGYYAKEENGGISTNASPMDIDSYNVGTGIGILIFLSEHLVLSGSMGYKFYYEEKIIDYYIPETKMKTDLGFGFGFVYYY